MKKVSNAYPPDDSVSQPDWLHHYQGILMFQGTFQLAFQCTLDAVVVVNDCVFMAVVFKSEVDVCA